MMKRLNHFHWLIIITLVGLAVATAIIILIKIIVENLN